MNDLLNFSDVIQFRQQLKALKYAPATIRAYCCCLSKFLTAFRHKSISTITDSEIEAYILSLLERKKYSPSYIRQLRRAIICFFKLRYKRNLCICTSYKIRHKSTPPVISQAEIEAMLLCANSLKQRCIILFLYGTGIRLKELIELKIDDIDFKKQELHIQSGSYPRSVPIPKKAINDLIRYCQTYLPKKYLFENQKHERCSARSIQKSIKAAAAKAGVRKEVSPRLLRYSFAIHLLRYGISPQYVKQLLGITSLNSLFCYNPYAPSNFVRPPSPLDIETIEVNSHN